MSHQMVDLDLHSSQGNRASLFLASWTSLKSIYSEQGDATWVLFSYSDACDP